MFKFIHACIFYFKMDAISNVLANIVEIFVPTRMLKRINAKCYMITMWLFIFYFKLFFWVSRGTDFVWIINCLYHWNGVCNTLFNVMLRGFDSDSVLCRVFEVKQGKCSYIISLHTTYSHTMYRQKMMIILSYTNAYISWIFKLCCGKLYKASFNDIQVWSITAKSPSHIYPQIS